MATDKQVVIKERLWSDCLIEKSKVASRRAVVIGVLPGEGIGPEVTKGAIEVLNAIADALPLPIVIRYGGAIGKDSERASGQALSFEVIDFCQEIFSYNGAILNGPGGGRYVYDLRKQLDLFFKISPLQVANGLAMASNFRANRLQKIDVLVTRENRGGVYQGKWDDYQTPQGVRVASHEIFYSEQQVMQFLEASARLAMQRRGHMTIAWKESGVPSMSQLWQDCADSVAKAYGVDYDMVDIDLMAYRLIQEASAFDVVAAPNLFGDVLADLGAVLLGGRGVSYSGNFTPLGHAVYQTNHGAAYDIAGKDIGNPIGQILSLAMMLRESFGFSAVANSIEQAVRSVWQDGYCTADMAISGAQILGTEAMSQQVAQRAKQLVASTPLKVHLT